MKINKSAKNGDLIFGVLSIAAAVILSVIYLVLTLLKAAGTIVVGSFLTLFGIPVFELFKAFGVGMVSIDFGLLLTGFILGVTWLVIAVKALLRAESARRYENIFKDFGNYPRIKFAEVAKKRNKSVKDASAELSVMRKRGYFPEMSVDLENKELVFSKNSEPLPKIGDDDKTLYKEIKKLPLFAVAATVICFFSFLMGQAILIVPSLLLSAGVFFLLLKFFPAPVYFSEEKVRIPVVKKPSATKNMELNDVLNSIYENKKELVRLMGAIEEPNIRRPLKEILRVLDEISAYVTENPEKVKTLRQFVNYYLPTTVRFLKTYEELNAKTDKGTNITTTLRKIEDVTAKMINVYKEQYDELFSERAMDVNADISVMQAIIDENK